MGSLWPIYGSRQFDAVQTIRTPFDMPANPSSSVLYYLDFAGLLEMNYSINVPAGGLFMSGHNLEMTGIGSTSDNFTLFTGAGAGNVFLSDMFLTTSGANSQVFGLTDVDGTHAIELNNINFTGCTSRGEITNYRQVLERNIGVFGGSPQLTLSGAMGGLRATTYIVRGLDSGFTGSLYAAGTGLTFSNRFLTDMNCDLPAGASISDFTSGNFLDSSLLQVHGGIFSRNGVINSGDNQFFPNLDPEDLVCEWRGNNGLRNTHEGGRLTVTTEAETVVSAVDTFYDVSGTWTTDNLQHFSSPVNGQLRNDGKNPQEFIAVGSFVIADGPNNVLNVKLVKWSESNQVFEDVHTVITQVLANTGQRDVAFVDFYYPVTLEVGDYVKLQVANRSGTSNVTFEVDSYLQLVSRA